MKEETREKIREALQVLDEATNVQGLSVFALIMPHGSRGTMDVQMVSKGDERQVAHKLYECMRYADAFPFDTRNIIMTAAAKWLGEQGDEARQAFDRTVEKCRKQWQDTLEMQAVLQDCREVIDEINDESDGNR